MPTSDRMSHLESGSVSIGGEIGRRIECTIENNLLCLDLEGDFLRPFRKKACRGGFVGTGKLADAMVRLAGHTDEPRLVDSKNHLIGELMASQDPDGYLGTFSADTRIWHLWDVHEIAFVITALVSDHRIFRTAGVLEAARHLADYVVGSLTRNPARSPVLEGLDTRLPELTTLGLEEALLGLYEVTREQAYLDFVVDHAGLAAWDLGIIRGRYGKLEGHAYAYLCKCVAQLRLRRVLGDDGLLGQTRRAMEFLTTGDGMCVSGGFGYLECWHDDQDGGPGLGETCASAYLLMVLDELIRLEGLARYGDLMERVIFNTLFAAQSPDGRRIRYYTPFEGPREYWEPDTYCCPNNYRRAIGLLPDLLYYKTPHGLAVNLYSESRARIILDGGPVVEIRQETDYPTSGNVLLSVGVETPTRFCLDLRIPRWCASPRVTVNGDALPEPSICGTFQRLDRTWNAGDVVETHFPMEPRMVRGRRAQSGRVALLRGPQLFCLNPTRVEPGAGVTGDHELRYLTIDPETPGEPKPDASVRPNGVSVSLQAWSYGKSYVEKPDLTLHLSEFPDPAGRATYFRVPRPDDPSLVDDTTIAHPRS